MQQYNNEFIGAAISVLVSVSVCFIANNIGYRNIGYFISAPLILMTFDGLITFDV